MTCQQAMLLLSHDRKIDRSTDPKTLPSRYLNRELVPSKAQNDRAKKEKNYWTKRYARYNKRTKVSRGLYKLKRSIL